MAFQYTQHKQTHFFIIFIVLHDLPSACLKLDLTSFNILYPHWAINPSRLFYSQDSHFFWVLWIFKGSLYLFWEPSLSSHLYSISCNCYISSALHFVLTCSSSSCLSLLMEMSLCLLFYLLNKEIKSAKNRNTASWLISSSHLCKTFNSYVLAVPQMAWTKCGIRRHVANISWINEFPFTETLVFI